MQSPASELPDDVDALKALVLAMAEKADALDAEAAELKALKASADERIARLTPILKSFERARFGRRSEKLGSQSLDDEQSAFVFDEIETGLASIQAELGKRQSADTKPNARLGYARASPRILSGSKLSSSRTIFPRMRASRKS